MVMRRGHPASRRTLSAAAFAALPHLEISSSREDTGFIDRWLAGRKLARRITLRVPYLAAAPILVQSDMVATLSRRIALEFVRSHPLILCEPPYDSLRMQTVMLWHRRLDHHPAHRWLRDTILSVTKRAHRIALNRSAQNGDYIDLADQPLFHKTDATFDRFVAFSHFGTRGQATALLLSDSNRRFGH
jgi:hypothetical protein